MRYLINKAMYYLCFFDKAGKEGMIEYDFSSYYDGICAIFHLSDNEKKEILRAFENEDFSAINSADVANFHIHFLDNIGGAGGLYGQNTLEKEMIKNKREALEFFEKLKNSSSDLINAFEKNIENKRVSISFALLHYLNFGGLTDKLMSQLRKSATAKDFCEFDGLIFLLSADTNNAMQYKKILEMSNFKFYNSDYKRIMKRFAHIKEADYNDNSRKIG